MDAISQIAMWLAQGLSSMSKKEDDSSTSPFIAIPDEYLSTRLDSLGYY